MKNRKVVLIWISLLVFIGSFSIAMASGQTRPSAKAPARIDLNRASAEQIGKCPGLTSSLANAIVEYRGKSGPFKSPEDLLKVKGITREILNKIKPKMDKGLLYITPASPASDEDEDEPSLKPSKC
jgi:competence ComEA-like helix-hairpin-helix protein